MTMDTQPLIILQSIGQSESLVGLTFGNARWSNQEIASHGLVITEGFGLKIIKEGDTLKIYRTIECPTKTTTE
jgi:hypothetical protein